MQPKLYALSPAACWNWTVATRMSRIERAAGQEVAKADCPEPAADSRFRPGDATVWMHHTRGSRTTGKSRTRGAESQGVAGSNIRRDSLGSNDSLICQRLP